MKTYLGVELGSTRIKAVQISENYEPLSAGGYTWASTLENGYWTYDLAEAWKGLKIALSQIENRETIAWAGISGMMHGYLAFDAEWNLLVPFRTWQNTTTGPAAEALTEAFGFNIPQRWCIAHLYQAVLNQEAHIGQVAHITTLAGYIHYMLTGENVVSIAEASGMFPIDSDKLDYNGEMVTVFEELTKGQGWNLRELLPRIRLAGEPAGCLTEDGARRIDDLLPVGTPFAAAESDAGTGMTATNAVEMGTGNVSAGTSIFAMVVLEKGLSKVYPEIDMVTTPTGRPVAMVHCNNCTLDMNAWVSVFRENLSLFGQEIPDGELFTRLYQKSLEGDADCGGVVVYNYLTGEGVTHIDDGRPLVARKANARFTLANFLKACLYSSMVTLKVGLELLEKEKVQIRSLTGHGGLFKTPVVGQSYLAAACNAPITCIETAGEGGAYGMALLAAYCDAEEKTGLEKFLKERVFAGVKGSTLAPEPGLVKGFADYTTQFLQGFAVERHAVETL